MKKNVALSTSAHDDTHTGVQHAAQLTRLGFRTVLLDFDLTLVNEHCYQNDITPQAVRDMSSSDFHAYFNDAGYSVHFLSTLVTTAGTSVAIVSFGRHDVIAAFLSRLLDREGIGHSQHIGIHTPLSKGILDYSQGHEVPTNKNELLDAILQTRSQDTTLIIDDDPNILDAAKTGFPHIHTLHISTQTETRGMAPSHIENFLKHFTGIQATSSSHSPERQRSHGSGSRTTEMRTPPSTARSTPPLRNLSQPPSGNLSRPPNRSSNTDPKRLRQ